MARKTRAGQYRRPNCTIRYAYAALNARRTSTMVIPERPSNWSRLGFTLFQVTSIISFVFTASRVLVVNILAPKTPELRATILQMSAFITLFGTQIHTFYVDPELSRAADSDPHKTYSLVCEFIVGRAVGSFILLIFFVINWAYEY
jgi:hypothetical protein